MWYSFDDNGWKVVIVNLVNNNMKFLNECNKVYVSDNLLS